MNSFKTPKGTTLPLMDIKGKDYLQVAHRIVWFREEHPNWSITTSVSHTEKMAVSRAEIRDDKGYTIATAHKRETIEGFYDFVEKSETGAIGRALALCGYGTQFTDDLDEGERLADSPIPPRRSPPVHESVPQTIPTVAGGDYSTAGKWDHAMGRKPYENKPFDKSRIDPLKKISEKQVKFLCGRTIGAGWDIKTQLGDYLKIKYGVERLEDITNGMLDEILQVLVRPHQEVMDDAINSRAQFLSSVTRKLESGGDTFMQEEDIPF